MIMNMCASNNTSHPSGMAPFTVRLGPEPRKWSMFHLTFYMNMRLIVNKNSNQTMRLIVVQTSNQTIQQNLTIPDPSGCSFLVLPGPFILYLLSSHLSHEPARNLLDLGVKWPRCWRALNSTKKQTNQTNWTCLLVTTVSDHLVPWFSVRPW